MTYPITIFVFVVKKLQKLRNALKLLSGVKHSHHTLLYRVSGKLAL